MEFRQIRLEIKLEAYSCSYPDLTGDAHGMKLNSSNDNPVYMYTVFDYMYC